MELIRTEALTESEADVIDEILESFVSMQRIPKKIRDRNQKRYDIRKCLSMFGDVECDNPMHERGLCSSCYQFYIRERAKRSGKKRIEFELDQVSSGKILAKGAVLVMKRKNPFAKVG